MEPENSTSTNQTVTEPAPPASPAPSQPTPATLPGPGKKKLKMPVIIVAIIVALLGAGAAAYFGIIVPNKPENKLIAAFGNLAEKKQMTLSGKLDLDNEAGSGSLPGFALDYTAKSDTEKSLFGLEGTLGISGAQFPFELRSIDDDLYVKIDGLGSLDDSVSGQELSDDSMAYVQLLSNLDNQWYVIDRSYLQELNESNSCFDDLSLTFSKEDIAKIEAAYRKYPLFTIKNTSKVDVDGVSTTKFELEPTDKQTAENFNKELESIELVKKLQECGEDSGVTDDGEEEAEADDDSTAVFNVYVTGKKEVKKIEITTTSKESELTLTMNFAFGPVEVEKPEGAKPVQELLGDLFGGDMGAPTLDLGSPASPMQDPTPYFQ